MFLGLFAIKFVYLQEGSTPFDDHDPLGSVARLRSFGNRCKTVKPLFVWFPVFCFFGFRVCFLVLFVIYNISIYIYI